jgi:hypothetical protein
MVDNISGTSPGVALGAATTEAKAKVDTALNADASLCAWAWKEASAPMDRAQAAINIEVILDFIMVFRSDAGMAQPGRDLVWAPA